MSSSTKILPNKETIHLFTSLMERVGKTMKTNRIIVVVLVFLICFQSAWAKILYRYQRDDGVIVTTDVFDNVPERYRNSVEKIPIMDTDELERLMERNIKHGRPILWGFRLWTVQLEKLIISEKKERVLELLGKPESISESGSSKIWRYDCDTLFWDLKDFSSKVKVKKIILTLGFRSQDHYVVDDISYSR